VFRPVSQIESLETRTLLTVSVSFGETFGLLFVDATDDGDVVLVEHDGTNIIVNGSMIPASDTGELATLANVTGLIVRGDMDVDEANDFRILSDFTGISVILQSGGGDDTMVGGPGPEVFLGQGGNNDIRGGGGNDTILAGSGADTLVGGLGNDSIEGGFGNDQLFGEEGDDTLIGGDGNDTLLGRDGADQLFGDAGNDLLFGESGNDMLDGGTGDDGFAFPGSSLGNDMVSDSGGEDYLDFGLIGNAVNIDLRSTATQTVASGDLVLTLGSGTAFEIVVGSAFDDTLIGNSADNFLFGNDGDDNIFGGTGNDFLFGQVGDDTLTGEAGMDTLNAGVGDDSQEGGSGSDTYIFDENASGTDMVRDLSSEAPNTDHDVFDFSAFTAPLNLDLGSTMPQTFGGLTLQLISSVSIENVIGTTGNDTVTGNACDNEILGGAGNDMLDGFDGADSLFGEAGNDNLFGGAGEDSLEGEAGEDTLSGDGGDDFLKGGSSSDTYAFSTDSGGNDTIQDQDSEAPNTDHDRLDFSVLPANVTVDLALTSTQEVAPGRSITLTTSTMIEDVLGGAGNDTLIGNAGDNVLDGGSSGNDDLSGDDGNDTLIGGSGSDTLQGGADDDSLEGGSGDDTYLSAPGWGLDEIVESSGGGGDTMDFATLGSPLQTTIGISNVEVRDTNGNRTTHSGNDIEHIVGGQGGNLITFQDGARLANSTGTITGGAGTDTLDYADYTIFVGINLSSQTATGLAGVFGFESIIGGQSSDDSIVGFDGGNFFVITGNNAGSVNGGFLFSAVENVIGSTDIDEFVFEQANPDNGSLTGRIEGFGGVDTLDMSAFTGFGRLNVDLANGTSKYVGGGFSNIEAFIGPGEDGTLSGPNDSNTWTYGSSTAGVLTSAGDTVTFSGFSRFVGGSTGDRFVIPDGLIFGSAIGLIDGRDGADVLDFTAYTSDLRASVGGTSLGVGQDLGDEIVESSRIERLIGGTAKNRVVGVTGFNVWNITGPDQLNLNNLKFLEGFQLISGGNSDDRFVVFPSGSLSDGVRGDLGLSNEGFDTLDYSEFTTGVVVDLSSGTAPGLPSIDLIEGVSGGSGNDSLTGLNDGTGGKLVGDGGNDTLTGGSGDFILQGLAGDDLYVLAPAGTVAIDEQSGSDRIDFRNADLAIQFDADRQGSQTINSRGDTLIISGEIEDVIGTELADTITAGPLGVPRFLDGRNPPGPGEGDTLIFDARGAVITAETSTSYSTSTFADVTHARFETRSSQNAGATTGTAGEVDETGDLIVTDNEGINSDLTVTVTDTEVLINSLNGPTTIDPADGTQIDPNSFVVPLGGITGGRIEVNSGDGDDTLTVGLPDTDLNGFRLSYDGGPGTDSLSVTGTPNSVIFSHTGSDSGVIGTYEQPLTYFSNFPSEPVSDTVSFRSVSIEYTGLEPVDMLGVTTSNLAFVLPDVDNVAVIEPGAQPGEYRLRSLNGTFETTDFIPPAEGIFVLCGSGHDSIDASAINFSIRLFGGPGNDTLIGGTAADVLNGAGGDDSLVGGNDDDTLLGGAGADLLDGGAGNDHLSGQGGSGDTLDGGAGDDSLNGGSGIDFVRISVNADIVLQDSQSAGEGTDRLEQLERAILEGGPANNRIDASAFSGSVVALGKAGSDTLIGGGANDTLIGGAGGDELRGGGGDDTLRGSAGRDTLQGEAGNDLLLGQGSSGDRLDGGTGDDTLDGGAGIDILVASADADFTLSDSLLTGQGTDTLRRLEQAELKGGVSANNINASAFSGITRLNGQGGNDTITGGSGEDVIAGGAGSDMLVGGLGNDRLLGQGSSGDTLVGGAGADTLDGGSGIDTITTDVLDSVIADVLDVIIST